MNVKFPAVNHKCAHIPVKSPCVVSASELFHYSLPMEQLQYLCQHGIITIVCSAQEETLFISVNLN